MFEKGCGCWSGKFDLLQMSFMEVNRKENPTSSFRQTPSESTCFDLWQPNRNILMALDFDEYVIAINHGNTDFPQNTCTVALKNISYRSLINGSPNVWRCVYKRIDGVASWASLTQGAVPIGFF